ncbi:MAG: capsule assembly Wzi family protein [Candidatus Cryptobacteroides sp.]
MRKNITYMITAAMLLLPALSYAGNWKTKVDVSLRGAYGTSDYMPFWARTGEEGTLPVTSSGLLRAGAKVEYMSRQGFFFEAEGDFAGALSQKNAYSPKLATAMVNRLYVSGGWKMLRLDVGMAPREMELGDLSLTGGDIIYSGNARNFTGINFRTDWIYFEKGHWFGIKLNYAHYQMIDNRYVKNTLLHNKSLSFKVACGRKVDFIAGLEHWAQWGGNSPIFGKQPASFKDYLRIVLGQSGGSDASLSDQINVLGNHLGREYVRVVWRAEPFTMTFQYDKPFEDGTGTRLQNVPDGVWTLGFSLKDRKAIVTDVMYELATTTWQSGPEHDRPATEEEMAKQDPSDPFYGRVVLGGADNYFSNGEYKSGWTYYGRTIGLPLITPAMPSSEDGITYGVVNNRVRAHHIALRGNIYLPYTFKSTFSKNFGRYHQGESSFFASTPWQLSLALEVCLDRFLGKLPLNLNVGLYGDIGKLYQNGFGLTLRFGFSELFD